MSASRYESAKQVCRRHAERLSWALEQLRTHLPFSPETLSTLTPVDLAICDQFVVRFAQLQDAMGTQMLPAILDLSGEPGPMPAFIDKLNRLEKIGAIRSAQDWLRLREMRNQFAHDYPDDPEIQASLFNKATGMADTLLEILDEAERFAQRHVQD